MQSPEEFVFSDFDVNVAENAYVRRKTVHNPPAKESEFVFGDFTVTVENELEDMIVWNHLKSKKGKLNQREEEAMLFAFGDFKLDQGEMTHAEQLRMKYRSNRRYIRNYSLKTMIGHSNRVKTVAMHPSEKMYLSCCNTDQDVNLFDAQTGKEVLVLVGHAGIITSAMFSNNCKFAVTTSADCSMILWDLVTGKKLFKFQHPKIVICACFTSNGRFIVSGSQDKICRVWDMKKKKIVRQYVEHNGIVIALSAHPSNDVVASGSSDKTVHVWNPTTGVRQNLLEGHTGIILSCRYSYDGSRLLTNDENCIRVWNTQNGSIVLTLSACNVTPLSRQPMSGSTMRRLTWMQCSFCPGDNAVGHYIVAACSDRTVRIYQGTTGKELIFFSCRAPVYTLAAGQRETIVFGDGFGNVYLARVF